MTLIAVGESELASLVNQLDRAFTKSGMEISAKKTKLMTNEYGSISADISVHGEKLETVQQFNYLRSTISDQGSRPEILARAAQTITALSKLKTIWRDNKISVPYKIRLLHVLVFSILLYTCETWPLTDDLQRKIQALEIRCFCTILDISYLDHIITDQIRSPILPHTGPLEALFTTVTKRKLRWYGHVTRADGFAKTILQGNLEAGRKRQTEEEVE